MLLQAISGVLQARQAEDTAFKRFSGKDFASDDLKREDALEDKYMLTAKGILDGLLHGGDILQLDEISSSLDEPTEYEPYSRLFTTYPQKTMLFITHRKAVTELCNDMVTFKHA